MEALVDPLAVQHGRDLGDSIGKQEFPVEDRDLGVTRGTKEPLT